MVTPGVSVGTTTIDCCLCLSALSGSVLPITIRTLHLGSPAPEDHHLRPFITKSSPSRVIRHSIFVASEDATAGSVIKNADLIRPSISGSAHSCCCSAVPYRSNVSIFPVSGAEQLNTSGAQVTRPMISHMGAYSTFVKSPP